MANANRGWPGLDMGGICVLRFEVNRKAQAGQYTFPRMEPEQREHAPPFIRSST